MKTKRTGAKPTGANAGGGTIEKGQSRSARNNAASSKSPKDGEAEWLDETERDTADREQIRNELTDAPATARRQRKDQN